MTVRPFRFTGNASNRVRIAGHDILRNSMLRQDKVLGSIPGLSWCNQEKKDVTYGNLITGNNGRVSTEDEIINRKVVSFYWKRCIIVN